MPCKFASIKNLTVMGAPLIPFGGGLRIKKEHHAAAAPSIRYKLVKIRSSIGKYFEKRNSIIIRWC